MSKGRVTDEERADGLTEKQAAFLDAYLESMKTGRPNLYQCAIEAGYAESTATHARTDILELPGIQKALDGRLAEIETEGGRTIRRSIPIALCALVDVAEHSKDQKARVNAAREILDRTGLIRREGKDVKQDVSPDILARIEGILTVALKATLTPEEAMRVGKFIKEKLCAGVETS